MEWTPPPPAPGPPAPPIVLDYWTVGRRPRIPELEPLTNRANAAPFLGYRPNRLVYAGAGYRRIRLGPFTIWAERHILQPGPGDRTVWIRDPADPRRYIWRETVQVYPLADLAPIEPGPLARILSRIYAAFRAAWRYLEGEPAP